MNYQAHRVGGVCAGTITATLAYSESIGNISTWNIETVITLGLVVTGSVLGAMLPDIDHPTSKIGKKVPFISKPVNALFGHRGFTHSILATLLLTYLLFLLAGILPLSIKGFYFPFALGVIVGYISHLILDMVTVSGIPLLYPFSKNTFNIAKLRTGRDDLLVSIIMLIGTGVYLYIFDIL